MKTYTKNKMNLTKPLQESLENSIGDTNWTYILRYCNWNDDYTYAHDYPILIETDDITEIIDYIEKNYSDVYELTTGSQFRKEYITKKLPYLHLIMSPSGRHSYIKTFSTKNL